MCSVTSPSTYARGSSGEGGICVTRRRKYCVVYVTARDVHFSVVKMWGGGVAHGFWNVKFLLNKSKRDRNLYGLLATNKFRNKTGSIVALKSYGK
jgi:hypothetical protein